MPGMTQLVRKDGSAEARRQRDAAIIPGTAARAGRRSLVCRLSVGPRRGDQQQS